MISKLSFASWYVTIARLSTCGSACLKNYIKYSQKFKRVKSIIIIKIKFYFKKFSENIGSKNFRKEV